ncbi:hypothetical protein C8Q75DRAFT_742107, partial [Abortiporus biennis]
MLAYMLAIMNILSTTVSERTLFLNFKLSCSSSFALFLTQLIHRSNGEVTMQVKAREFIVCCEGVLCCSWNHLLMMIWRAFFHLHLMIVTP